MKTKPRSLKLHQSFKIRTTNYLYGQLFWSIIGEKNREISMVTYQSSKPRLGPWNGGRRKKNIKRKKKKDDHPLNWGTILGRSVGIFVGTIFYVVQNSVISLMFPFHLVTGF